PPARTPAAIPGSRAGTPGTAPPTQTPPPARPRRAPSAPRAPPAHAPLLSHRIQCRRRAAGGNRRVSRRFLFTVHTTPVVPRRSLHPCYAARAEPAEVFDVDRTQASRHGGAERGLPPGVGSERRLLGRVHGRGQRLSPDADRPGGGAAAGPASRRRG